MMMGMEMGMGMRRKGTREMERVANDDGEGDNNSLGRSNANSKATSVYFVPTLFRALKSIKDFRLHLLFRLLLM